MKRCQISTKDSRIKETAVDTYFEQYISFRVLPRYWSSKHSVLTKCVTQSGVLSLSHNITCTQREKKGKRLAIYKKLPGRKEFVCLHTTGIYSTITGAERLAGKIFLLVRIQHFLSSQTRRKYNIISNIIIWSNFCSSTWLVDKQLHKSS